MIQKIGFGIAAVLLFMSVYAWAGTDRGDAQINIHGGKKGDVPFPHHLHQDALGDCMVCHDLFAKEKAAIKKSVAMGALKKKQVMNKTCIKCHRKQKKAGKPFGPVSCNACHKK